jgi:hypothetical protein
MILLKVWDKSSVSYIMSDDVTVQGAVCGSLENVAYHFPHLTKQDQCAVIQLLGVEDCQPAEIYQWMQAYGH